MEANSFRRCIVACWTACAALCACGASTYYVINLSGGPNAESYPMEILDGEPSGGWTTEHKTTKLVLRRIEAGTFNMCNQTNVTLTRPFFIGVFEVTSAQYAQVMGVSGSDNALPKANINYNDIRGSSDWPNSSEVGDGSFIGRLRARTGLQTIDIPTEAQWEYSCRAGTTNDFNNGTDLDLDPFGEDENLNRLGWYEGNSEEREPSEVGLLQPNAWGLYDMHGNVSEWCLDFYAETLTGGNDPKGSTSGSRVIRGGSYQDGAKTCTASSRKNSSASMSLEYCGFRIACFPAEIVHSATSYTGTYDGEGHGIEVTVTAPLSGTEVKYAWTEDGQYQTGPLLVTNATDEAVTVWYTVEAHGYDTVKSNSTVTIGKAMYDMSGVAWNYDEPFEGDGTEKTVSLLNLPAGVTATYTGNAATAPGEYTAHATLAYDTVNYLEPVVADLFWEILAPMQLGIDDIIGYSVTVGSNSTAQTEGVISAEGISDPTIGGGRSVVLTARDSSSVWLEVVVTNALSVSFDWKCSCEGLYNNQPWDYLAFHVDDERRDFICGITDWTNVTFSLNGEGVQTLRWTYIKDTRFFAGEDCAWVANVVITYAQEPEIRFTAISVEEGAVTVAVSMMVGETPQAISSTEVKDWIEATSDLSDWEGGTIPISVTALPEGVAETVQFRVTFTNGAPPRAFLRIRKP